MMRYLLDTTALIAHFRNEAGYERVRAILDEESNDVHICAISVIEMARRMASIGIDSAESRSISLEYAALATGVVAVDTAIAVRAFEIGSLCSARLPLADALIASAAASLDAVLVHRDSHFGSIPAELLSQESIA
jgi:predicted nucleic acid-binding protein